MSDRHVSTTTVQTDSDTRGLDATVGCELCEQTVPASEAVDVSIGSATTEHVCGFCASSMFDDVEVDTQASGVTVSARETPQYSDIAPATDDSRASVVTWGPPAVEANGLSSAILQTHLLSLTLIWAIHRTNVRLIERVIEEIDVETMVMLGLFLSTLTFIIAAQTPV